MATLTEDEKAFLQKIEKQKENNRLRQQKYLSKVKDNEEFKQSKAEYQRTYREQLKTKYNELQGVVNKVQEIPQPVNIQQITASQPISRKQKIYNKKHNITQDQDTVIPAHITRKEALEPSTINEYIIKLNIIHRLLTNNTLTPKLKTELTKLLNGNESITQYIILNMPYLKTINETIQELRQKYPNNNSFKSYLVPLTVVLSHLPTLNNEYQTITKVAKNINEAVQEIRQENIIPKGDEIKIIDLNKDVILSNIEKLLNIEDRLIYGLYTLYPARREDDYRLMRLTYDENAEDMNDEYNYINISKDGLMRFIFNQYKTRSTYKQQILNVPPELQKIILSYINQKSIKENEFLFFSNDNHKDKIAQSNFSTKISNTFKKIYGVPISIRFIRKSHATHIYHLEYQNKMTSKEVKEYQRYMAHSKSESDAYRVKGYK